MMQFYIWISLTTPILFVYLWTHTYCGYTYEYNTYLYEVICVGSFNDSILRLARYMVDRVTIPVGRAVVEDFHFPPCAHTRARSISNPSHRHPIKITIALSMINFILSWRYIRINFWRMNSGRFLAVRCIIQSFKTNIFSVQNHLHILNVSNFR